MMNCRYWLLQVLVVVVSPAQAQTKSGSPRFLANSNNFQVQSFGSGPDATKVLGLCEAIREELQRVWSGGETVAKWEPRCEVVLHKSRGSYLSVVGSGGGQTSGCSLIEFDEVKAGKIVTRRLDLLMDQRGAFPALAHELTHVVLADRFRGRQPPHWLDEGIAMLADTREKQILHARDCQDAIRNGKALPMTELLNLQQFSSAEQMPAFYGQSHSLVQMLAERDKPEKIIDFALDALDKGIHQALKLHYALDGCDDLERMWRNYAIGGGTPGASQPIVVVSFQP